MLRQLIHAGGMLLVLTVLCGVLYPLSMVGLAQVVFPFQANGSIIMQGETPIGSSLLGQSFGDEKYFHGRPSLAGDDGYDANGSAGSNLGPTNKKLIDTIADNVKKAREDNGLAEDEPIPSDLAMASGSGLDPDITPAAALLQAERVAKARTLEVGTVEKLIISQIKERQWGILGEERVNVLALNLALDKLAIDNSR
nr:potassium-transporting ATPase subunit KdpC [uncultured Anaeromusa sp.]